MESIGNIALLDKHLISFLAGSKIASLSIIPTLDWATEVAKREDIAVVSGFHSKMEREVLEFLLRGKCGIICVLARSIYKTVPPKFLKAFRENRVLFVSPFESAGVRASRDLCQKRNEYVASISDELIFSSVSEESSLYPLTQSVKKILLL